MAGTVTATPTAGQDTEAAPSIEARADQLMAAIGEAHEVVDGVLGAEPANPPTEANSGAEVQLDQCQAGLQSLISRLNQIRNRTGKL